MFPRGRWLMDILCKRPANTSHRRHPRRHIWTESFKPCVNLTSCHAFIASATAAGPDCHTATHCFVSLIQSAQGSCLFFPLVFVSSRRRGRTSCLASPSLEIDLQLSASLPSKDMPVCPPGGPWEPRSAMVLHSPWQCGRHLCFGPGNRKSRLKTAD